MAAVVLREIGEAPELGAFPRPPEAPGMVEVLVAGLNPVDLTLAAGGLRGPEPPTVVGREGIARTAAGERVYFSSSIAPYGSLAPYTLIDLEDALPVPADVSSELAVAMGIAGLAAWLPLSWHAALAPGERVLVLGATGVVGQIAVQAARILGAGQIVAAGRDERMLAHAAQLGADATVRLGVEDDALALARHAGGGYDVVIDTIYGAPFLAALRSSASGARLVTVGQGAGASVDVPFRALQGRTHVAHANWAVPRGVADAAYADLLRHAAAGAIAVEVERYELSAALAAWEAQRRGPHRKLVVTIAPG
jgi:NADPH:quinone reductase-like Zn-dependent oxidoreductase